MMTPDTHQSLSPVAQFVKELNDGFAKKGLTEMRACLKYREVFVSGVAPWERHEEVLQWLSDCAVSKGITINMPPPRMGGAGGKCLAFFVNA